VWSCGLSFYELSCLMLNGVRGTCQPKRDYHTMADIKHGTQENSKHSVFYVLMICGRAVGKEVR